MSESPRYTFGDTPAAAARLKSIASVFNPLADKVVRRFVTRASGSCGDLGCGPGYTTDMLAAATMCLKVYGFDRSAEFLTLARQNFPDYEFIGCDITRRLPVRVHVLYARSVLSHMKAPVMLANDWAAQLPPAGLLFLHELEAIDTDVPVFRRYLEVNRQLLASQGAELFVGKTLAAGNYHYKLLANETQATPVPTRLAAAWFLPNVESIWPAEQAVCDSVAPEERDEIAASLRELASSFETRSDITWTMRWVVVSERW